eukprot:1413644-Alexandrium_andersonii.AAC.1
MSASLVGSEMCIRDSFNYFACFRGHARFAPGVLANWVLAGPRRRSRPVSYTHLTLPTICSV